MKKISQINDILFRKLFKIEPSRDCELLYYPCQVLLENNEQLDTVYVVEEKAYFKVWGVYPEDDPGKKSISIERVEDIKESPYRLPAKLANKMYKAGESGMGYCVFTLVMRNGDRLPFVTGDAVDFPNLPPNYSYKDIVDLLPHVGRDKLQDKEHNWIRLPYTTSAEYFWCLFSKRTKGPFSFFNPRSLK